MNKDKALKFAKDYIEELNFKENPIDKNKPFETICNQRLLEDDPNLEILKSELNKAGFNISKTPNSNSWTISKLN